PEIAVASTKAYSTQLLVMYLLGLYLAQKRGTLPEEIIASTVRELRGIADKVEAILEKAGAVEAIAEKYAATASTFFIGRGLDYAVALEGALKLKEISYVHAEAYAAGELKHGTLALIEKGVPVIAIVTQDELQDKMISNIKEVKARGAEVIGIAKEGLAGIEEETDELFVIPGEDSLLTPMLTVVPLQLFAYYMAVKRGCDVDKPRNLAKSVTVE
ncbi:MAG TPA: SIS domain-containing protein, partial [Syntrophothermus lipocalidus]|nr:SIS domain-containing protein [Syntrophothermus lipocalidus]